MSETQKEFDKKAWESTYIANSILRALLVLSSSSGRIQHRLYGATRFLSNYTTGLEDFDTMWSIVRQKIKKYTDKKHGTMNCTDVEAKHLVAYMFTCLSCIIEHNSKFVWEDYNARN